MRQGIRRRWGLAVALLAAFMSIGFLEPSGVPFARARLALIESRWEMYASRDAWAPELRAMLDEAGSLHNLWMYLRSLDVHYGPERAAIDALRLATISDVHLKPALERNAFERFVAATDDYATFQVAQCAPTSFPGGVGYGAHTALRCVLSTPTYRGITSLDNRGLANGAGKCNALGDSAAMQPGGFVCETVSRPGFRIANPRIEGTRGRTGYGNAVLITSDSLLYLGYLFGANDETERYDHRPGAWTSDRAQGYWRVAASNVIISHTTSWDMECGTPSGSCDPSEQTPFVCGTGVNGTDSVYIYSMSQHGNSGDDVYYNSCSWSTGERLFLGPVQSGGGQTTCHTGGGTETHPDSALTTANSICYQAGHRVPEGATATVNTVSGDFLGGPNFGHGREFVNWIVFHRNSRAIDVAGPRSYGRGLFRSVLFISNRQEWMRLRALSRHASSNTLFTTFWLDSQNVHLNLGNFAIDHTTGDGFNLNARTYGGSAVSFWDYVVCDGAAGQTGVPCEDTFPAGNRTIDSTAFHTNIPVDSSTFVGDVLLPEEFYDEIGVKRRVGNRYRVRCDGTIADSLAHSAFADSMFALIVNQTQPAGLPGGDEPSSMTAWWAGYPTSAGAAANNVGSTYTPCTMNVNDVPLALAQRINPGNPGSVTWNNDQDGDGYPLYAEMVAPSDPTVFTNPDGSEGGGGGTPAGVTWGGGGGLRVRLVNMVLDTFYFAGGDPPGDTVVVVIPVTPPQVIPSQITGRWCYNAAAMRAAHITTATSTAGAPVQDSSAATDTLDAWGLPGCVEQDLKANPPG